MLQFINKHWFSSSVLLLLLCAGWIALSTRFGVPSTEITAPAIGFQAPDFTLTTTQGEVITLSELRGQPVIINFWASWCLPCRSEMPAMQEMYHQYQANDFEILAINTTYQDQPDQVESYIQELGLTFPVLFDLNGEVANRYQVSALPTSFFIQPDGTIQEIIIGGPIPKALLVVRIEKLLGEVP